MAIMMRLLWLMLGCVLVTACTNSQVSRDVSSQVNQGYRQTHYTMSHLGGSEDLVSSPRRQGMMLGTAAGATTGWFYPSVGVLPGAAAGLIIGASYGAYLEQHMTLIDRLQSLGVKVIVLGDQVLMVIPASVLFESGQPRFQSGAYKTLHFVVEYINSFLNMSVRITGYSNEYGSGQRSLEVSRQQAQLVQRSLWSMGVNTRLLYAEGRGARHFVDDTRAAWPSRSLNDRIEIRLEKLPG